MEAILDCGHKPSFPRPDHTTGYGTDRNGKTACFECCAEQDRKQMQETGRIDLYLSKNSEGRYEVSNWPGTLKIPVFFYRDGKHNIAGSRIDVWFRGPDGFIWWGVQYGEWTQICHCKRTRKTEF